ncbi:DUF4350 domain-containing protein [Schaalia vaccimaxillae]|uniref:DUF4350 domain-containing protein n=1 Tax=Schaalia vaccimaxillae TaxID=183916 RepID=UPI0003B60E27|nr:DUF4350 domain-containing protein [Schaalia vaccimaxillae]
MRASSSTVITARPSTRLAQAKPVLVILLLMLLSTAVIFFIPQAGRSDEYLATDNATPKGAQALVRVLEDQGVTVKAIDSPTELVTRSGPDTTAVVISPSQMQPDVAAAISELNNVVYVGMENHYSALEDSVYSQTVADTSGAVTAQCDSAGAQRAADIVPRHFGLSISVDPWQFEDDPAAPDNWESDLIEEEATLSPVPSAQDWSLCFPLGPEVYSFAEYEGSGFYRAVFADSQLITNGTIATGGHGALAMNAMGRTPTVLWYLANPDHEMFDPAALQPGYLMPALVIIVAAVIVGGIGWGWRLGRLVVEDIATPVPASEVLIGKGRLLRRSRAYGYAAQALRTAHAKRMARKLGVSVSGSAHDLQTDLAARGIDPQQSHDLYWGPAPTTEGELVRLARALEALEEELEND